MRIFVPRDAAARALGADAVARAVAAEARRRGIEVELVRNGTRGMVWLEPLVEVETGAGRTGFGPVARRGRAGAVRRRLRARIRWRSGRSRRSRSSPGRPG